MQRVGYRIRRRGLLDPTLALEANCIYKQSQVSNWRNPKPFFSIDRYIPVSDEGEVLCPLNSSGKVLHVEPSQQHRRQNQDSGRNLESNERSILLGRCIGFHNGSAKKAIRERQTGPPKNGVKHTAAFLPFMIEAPRKRPMLWAVKAPSSSIIQAKMAR